MARSHNATQQEQLHTINRPRQRTLPQFKNLQLAPLTTTPQREFLPSQQQKSKNSELQKIFKTIVTVNAIYRIHLTQCGEGYVSATMVLLANVNLFF